jgi:hypothetical protein
MSLFLAAVALGAAAPANAPPQRAGECRWVLGRYAVYNGSGVRRIWVMGTRRIVVLHDDDSNVPPAIERYHARPDPGYGLDDALFGDFYVCARENSRPGWMQHVRLLRTRNLIFRGRRFPGR